MKPQGRLPAAHPGVASPEPAAHAFDLFVVHAAADADFVRGYLLPALNLPASRILLVDDLTPGAPVVAEIARGVSRSRFTIAVLSPAFLEDRWAVLGEQLASYMSVEDVHVIPLRLAGCEVSLQLESRVALDFTDRLGWEDQATRLRKLLHTSAPTEEPLACPYPGRHAFAAHEASWFFGRDRELDDLIGRLDRCEREIYVIGPSGAGKSSLVHAGLAHALSAGTSRLGRSFAVCAMRPGDRPTDRLAKALQGDHATPAATVDAFLARHRPAARLLVLVDQLEELFTLADPTERRRFIAMLRMLRAEPRCHLMFVLRTDTLGTLLASGLRPGITGISRLDLTPLRGTALAEVITAPAMRAGVHLEARLCDRLVADIGAEPGTLPHLQETLQRLWARRRQRLIGLAEYEALGNGGSGLYAAIAQHADATMRAMTEAEQAMARRMLIRLVSFGEGRADTRRQQEVPSLRSAADDEGTFTRVLQRLADRRLVTVGATEQGGGVLVDLSHEALITAWPALRAWIAQRRADEQQRRRLDGKVAEWIERGRGTASLLDAVELAEAVHWMQGDAARELGYGADLPALVAASQTETEALERQDHAAWRMVGMACLEQGGTLRLDGRPLQVLPYRVAAEPEAMGRPVLHRLVPRSSKDPPVVTFRTLRRPCRSRRRLRA